MAHLEAPGGGSPGQLERWLPALVGLAAFGAWEWLSRGGRISPILFPPPSVVARTLVSAVTDGMVWDLTATLSRLLLGLVLGGASGLILGLGMGWSRRLRAAVDPLIAAVHPIPKIALLPIILILFGIGEASKVVIVAVAAFFPLAINAMSGVQQISPIHFEVAANYGASPLKVLTRVVLPGSLPSVLTGARLALNLALLMTITVELTTAREGLGAMIWTAWETLRTERLYAGVIVIAALGISFNLLLQRLALRLAPWQIQGRD
jgi:NitT/TauT family transport system permease protein